MSSLVQIVDNDRACLGAAPKQSSIFALYSPVENWP
jgi:hypothetical protein